MVFPYFRAAMLCALCSSGPQQEPEPLEQGLHLLASAAKCQAEGHKYCRQEGREGRGLIHAAMIRSFLRAVLL